MSGHVSEEALALYVSGDLPSDQSRAIGEHLGSCGECRTSLSEFNEAQSLLTEVFREPVWDDLTELRQRIADRVRARRSTQQWIWWLSGAAAMVLILFLGVRRSPEVAYRAPVNTVAHVTRPRNPAPAPAPPEPHPGPRARAETVRVKRRPVAPGIRSVALITRADQPPVIRISTTDPNVIILWQSDEGTERK